MNEKVNNEQIKENLCKIIPFDLEEAEKIIKRIEEFNPKDNLRKIEAEDGSGTRYYLDTKDRIVWFRKTFPLGKVYKILRECTEDHATFEVRVYMNRNDEPDNFLANGFATRYKDPTTEFGINFLESAETAALGRALKDAGFGTQSCGMEIQGETDDQIVDGGVYVSYDISNNDSSTPEEANTEETPADASTENEGGTDTTTSSSAPVKTEPPKLSKEMPVDELLSKLTLETAKEIVVEIGYDKGKTLGSLMESKPKSIVFHSTYEKNNNLVKAGALFLIEKANEM